MIDVLDEVTRFSCAFGAPNVTLTRIRVRNVRYVISGIVTRSIKSGSLYGFVLIAFTDNREVA